MRKLALTVVFLAVLGGMAGTTAQASNYTSAKRAVCAVFGSYCSQAMKVVSCETGGSYSPWATNGQYHGIFQMGSNERATYGDGWNVWAQAKAAFRYFIASGRDWSPWQCKPW